MADPRVKETAPPPTRAELCEQIGRSVGTLWARHSGVRPESVDTEYDGDVIRCEIHPGPSLEVESEDGEEASGSIGAVTYQRQAQAEVARLTGRTVLAFIAKTRKDAVSTNAFVLEPILVKY
jgi:hypothetical protein